MLDRASFSGDKELLDLITRDFVPVALDVWYHQRREDAEGDFYRKIVFQREGSSPEKTTQGFYIATAAGELIHGWNNRDPDKVKRLLCEARKQHRSKEPEPIDPADDPRFNRAIPEGAAVVDVYSKVLEADYSEPEDHWSREFRRALGRDHLWILDQEIADLEGGTLPQSLLLRIVRFHFIDNTRGEPPLWEPSEVKMLKVDARTAGVTVELKGRVELASEDGGRGFRADVLGMVECRDGVLHRFDLVARGECRGHGTYTANSAPQGPFSLAIAFTLAAKDDPAALVPPQGARDLADYLSPRNP